MEGATNGPLSVLHDCMQYGIKAKVWVRRYKGLRGCLTGYIAAFDHHMNLALIDVEEVYTLETWMVGEPLKKYQKKVLKKREEKCQLKSFAETAQPIKPSTGATKKPCSGGGVKDYLKKLTQSLRQNTSSPTLFANLHRNSAMTTNKPLEQERKIVSGPTVDKNPDSTIDKDSNIAVKTSHIVKSAKPEIVTGPRLHTSNDTLTNRNIDKSSQENRSSVVLQPLDEDASNKCQNVTKNILSDPRSHRKDKNVDKLAKQPSEIDPSQEAKPNNDIWSVLKGIDFDSLTKKVLTVNKETKVEDSVTIPSNKEVNLDTETGNSNLQKTYKTDCSNEANLKNSKGIFHKIPLELQAMDFTRGLSLDPLHPDPRLRPREVFKKYSQTSKLKPKKDSTTEKKNTDMPFSIQAHQSNKKKHMEHSNKPQLEENLKERPCDTEKQLSNEDKVSLPKEKRPLKSKGLSLDKKRPLCEERTSTKEQRVLDDKRPNEQGTLDKSKSFIDKTPLEEKQQTLEDGKQKVENDEPLHPKGLFEQSRIAIERSIKPSVTTQKLPDDRTLQPEETRTLQPKETRTLQLEKPERRANKQKLQPVKLIKASFDSKELLDIPLPSKLDLSLFSDDSQESRVENEVILLDKSHDVTNENPAKMTSDQKETILLVKPLKTSSESVLKEPCENKSILTTELVESQKVINEKIDTRPLDQKDTFPLDKPQKTTNDVEDVTSRDPKQEVSLVSPAVEKDENRNLLQLDLSGDKPPLLNQEDSKETTQIKKPKKKKKKSKKNRLSSESIQNILDSVHNKSTEEGKETSPSIEKTELTRNDLDHKLEEKSKHIESENQMDVPPSIENTEKIIGPIQNDTCQKLKLERESTLDKSKDRIDSPSSIKSTENISNRPQSKIGPEIKIESEKIKLQEVINIPLSIDKTESDHGEPKKASIPPRTIFQENSNEIDVKDSTELQQENPKDSSSKVSKTHCKFLFHSIANRLKSLNEKEKSISGLENRQLRSDIQKLTPEYEIKRSTSPDQTFVSPVKKPSRNTIGQHQSRDKIQEPGLVGLASTPNTIGQGWACDTSKPMDLQFSQSSSSQIGQERTRDQCEPIESHHTGKSSNLIGGERSRDEDDSLSFEHSYEAANTLLLLATSRPGSPSDSDENFDSENESFNSEHGNLKDKHVNETEVFDQSTVPRDQKEAFLLDDSQIKFESNENQRESLFTEAHAILQQTETPTSNETCPKRETMVSESLQNIEEIDGSIEKEILLTGDPELEEIGIIEQSKVEGELTSEDSDLESRDQNEVVFLDDELPPLPPIGRKTSCDQNEDMILDEEVFNVPGIALNEETLDADDIYKGIETDFDFANEIKESISCDQKESISLDSSHKGANQIAESIPRGQKETFSLDDNHKGTNQTDESKPCDRNKASSLANSKETLRNDSMEIEIIVNENEFEKEEAKTASGEKEEKTEERKRDVKKERSNEKRENARKAPIDLREKLRLRRGENKEKDQNKDEVKSTRSKREKPSPECTVDGEKRERTKSSIKNESKPEKSRTSKSESNSNLHKRSKTESEDFRETRKSRRSLKTNAEKSNESCHRAQSKLEPEKSKDLKSRRPSKSDMDTSRATTNYSRSESKSLISRETKNRRDSKCEIDKSSKSRETKSETENNKSRHSRSTINPEKHCESRRESKTLKQPSRPRDTRIPSKNRSTQSEAEMEKEKQREMKNRRRRSKSDSESNANLKESERKQRRHSEEERTDDSRKKDLPIQEPSSEPKPSAEKATEMEPENIINVMEQFFVQPKVKDKTPETAAATLTSNRNENAETATRKSSKSHEAQKVPTNQESRSSHIIKPHRSSLSRASEQDNRKSHSSSNREVTNLTSMIDESREILNPHHFTKESGNQKSNSSKKVENASMKSESRKTERNIGFGEGKKVQSDLLEERNESKKDLMKKKLTNLQRKSDFQKLGLSMDRPQTSVKVASGNKINNKEAQDSACCDDKEIDHLTEGKKDSFTDSSKGETVQNVAQEQNSIAVKSTDSKHERKIDFDSLAACMTKIYETKTSFKSLKPSQQDSEDEDNDINEKEKQRPVSELNIFQKRRQQSNEVFLKTRVKRMYGWLERDEHQEKGALPLGQKETKTLSTDETNAKLRIETKDTEDIHTEENFLDENNSDGGADSESKLQNKERLMWRQEVAKRRQRELINKVRGETFTPSIQGRLTTKGIIYKRRHVNQLFVRGDNIVLVAFDRPDGATLPNEE
uniref:LSM domain-containing protein n=2 Tax=Clytia hemisphaerica TaxID=252671 RepID=A0A7M5V760_9CNID